FNGTNGEYPSGNLIQGSDSNRYGMTSGGGTYNFGTVFKCATSGTLTTLYNLNDTNGANCLINTNFYCGSLIQATDGTLYGMTPYGGASGHGFGTIFKCSTAGVFGTIHIMGSTPIGFNPQESLIQASDSNVYGLTNCGGTYGAGTVFKYSTAGALTTLVSFNDTNGGGPLANLVQASDGNFYGTTGGGG